MQQPINLLNLCEGLLAKWHSEEELRIPVEYLRKFGERNGLQLIKRNFKGVYKYKMVRRSINTIYISDESEKRFSFLDIADIHIGNKYFDEQMLRNILEEAFYRNVNQVFIAGDIFEGFNFSEFCNKIYLDSINRAVDIFSEYKLDYYAICGNHDYSYEQIGLPNPLKRIAAILKEKNINFNYFDQYLVDFIICGVGKRVMHVERQDYNKKNEFQIAKLNAFERKGFINSLYQNQEFPLRFFEVGHIHDNLELYYSKKKIYISQPGSFLTKDNISKRGNFISGRIDEERVILDDI